MLSTTENTLPRIVELFPKFKDRFYFQNPDTREYWFCASNVCSVLGFSNPSSALAFHCDDDEKLMEVVEGKAMLFVSEAGCYGLAMEAKNDVAKKFKRWLKHEVLLGVSGEAKEDTKLNDLRDAAWQIKKNSQRVYTPNDDTSYDRWIK